MVDRETAQKEFEEITHSFTELNAKGSTLEEMCRHFDGRLDPVFELFDFNYKHLTATVFMKDGQLVLSPSVEVWEDNGWDYRTEELWID